MACTFYEPLYFRCKIFLLRCIEKINLASGRLTFRRRKIKEVVLERKKLLGKIKTNLQLPMLWFNCVFCKTMDNFWFWHSAHTHTHIFTGFHLSRFIVQKYKRMDKLILFLLLDQQHFHVIQPKQRRANHLKSLGLEES